MVRCGDNTNSAKPCLNNAEDKMKESNLLPQVNHANNNNNNNHNNNSDTMKTSKPPIRSSIESNHKPTLQSTRDSSSSHPQVTAGDQGQLEVGRETNTATATANSAKISSSAVQRKIQAQLESHNVEASNEESGESEANESKESRPESGEQPEIGLLKKASLNCLLYLIRSVINLYDLISQPVYYFKHEVYKKKHEVDQVERSRQLDSSDPNSPWRQVNIDPRQFEIEKAIDTFETYDEMMRASFARNSQKLCYSYRQVLHEQWLKRADSDKLFKQVKLSPFKWITFAHFERQIEAARAGFLEEGIKAGDKVMLYADTRPEWQISSQALIRLGAIVGTMYSTLGVDGIVHSVNETQVSHVVAQKDKVSKLLKLKAKLPRLKRIIYFEQVLKLVPELGGQPQVEAEQTGKDESAPSSNCAQPNEQWPSDFEHPQVECMSFNELLRKGSNLLLGSQAQERLAQLELASWRAFGGQARRNKDSIAVIMYTSGSTGIPKGVLISHRNIMATIKSFSYVTKDFVHHPDENVCTAYLPLAHIFEFCIESVMLYHGVRFGFATPHTLTDKSPGLQPGERGDLSLLQPTVMIIVPLILDRIVQGVKQALRGQSYFKERLVTYLIDYKIYWQKRFYETPLVDKIVCSKIATALGGRAKYVICGSAPLSGETQTFVRAALNLKLPQGFGTTETCAATACQLFEDQSTCNVGLPVAGALIKLEPWLEGNYRPSDKPHPRGEIVVGGEMIAHGYFNLDEQTREAFYVDDEGIRWYRTGDIGEFLPNGNLKIIDRKKDLVKLQNGEYISLGKVESTLKSNPFTDNFCVYANSNHNFVVALGPANEAAIRALGQQIVDEFARKSPSMVARNEERKGLLMGESEQMEAIEEIKGILGEYEADRLNNNEQELAKMNERKMSSLSTNSAANLPANCINERLNRLCENSLLLERVLYQLRKLAQERNLMGLEIPKKVLLLAEEWTEDKNLVTAAMKIRRNYIYKRFRSRMNIHPNCLIKLPYTNPLLPPEDQLLDFCLAHKSDAILFCDVDNSNNINVK